jgi:hypothetical protein
MRQTQGLIVTWGVTIDEFVNTMQRAANSMARVMADE